MTTENCTPPTICLFSFNKIALSLQPKMITMKAIDFFKQHKNTISQFLFFLFFIGSVFVSPAVALFLGILLALTIGVHILILQKKHPNICFKFLL